MPHLSVTTSAALSVVLSAATGLATNLLTDELSWGLGTGLAVLVVLSAGLAWVQAHGASTGGRTEVRQVVRSGGSITDGRVTARGAATVAERARRNGRISRSTVQARDASVVRDAKKGTIDGQQTDARG
ncbi:hypothetical protein [Streptomyces maremycinicus]|uniref:hypothetical protein n=1 Tax=Streptomyces maremycinicus TaxID=1679753 RepID=UPI000788D9E6|nr:hypothetical protein [Streptomyces sp. NBRC 110468]